MGISLLYNTLKSLIQIFSSFTKVKKVKPAETRDSLDGDDFKTNSFYIQNEPNSN